MRAAGGGVSDGHAFTGVRDQRKLCPFVLSTVEKPLRGSKAGARNQLSKSFLGKKIINPLSFPLDTSSSGTPTLNSCAFLAHSVLG